MLTPQADDIDMFYQITGRENKSHNGIISNMSGHSQAGPGVAYTASKYGLKENRTIKLQISWISQLKSCRYRWYFKGTGSLS